MSNPAKGVTVRNKSCKSTDVHKHKHSIGRTLRGRDPHHAVVENGMTAPCLCAVGVVGAELHPTNDWAVGSNLKTTRPTLAGCIYV